MLKIKYVVVFVVLMTSLLRAELLQTSDELSNLEIVTDSDCVRTHHKVNTATPTPTPEPVKEKIPSELQVETVNYKLHACDGVSSFPVTVRSNKMQGRN